MTIDLKNHISGLLDAPIITLSPIHGGDISKAYRIDTINNSFFLKVNTTSGALKMFQAEVYGLQLIARTSSIKTPEVVACSSYYNFAFLILEFIESKSTTIEDLKYLGYQLAQLHNSTSEQFGLDRDNYIGLLPQQNKQCKSWLEFYTRERLLPQLILARQNQMLVDSEIPSEEQIKNNLQPLFTDVKPTLVHGDFWNGNYIISKEGIPYLIDPAVYYGHHEVDIAMTRLFGGFGEAFYTSYYRNFKKDKHTENRIDIYQLYYLLVHLNLFGMNYSKRVKTILKKHF